MKRVFSNPIVPLLAGASLRLFFVLQFPAGSGDTIIYDQLATNWLKFGKYAMDIAGQPVSVDIRMPGYPAFLALIYALTGHTGEAARRFIMLAQILVDLSSCLLIAALAALLTYLCTTRKTASHLPIAHQVGVIREGTALAVPFEPPKPGALAPEASGAPTETHRTQNSDPRRAFLITLWLAALCPFTANYTAVPLTEVWATFFSALATLLLTISLARSADFPFPTAEIPFARYVRFAPALGGFVIGLGTLFRPETPLLLAAFFLVLFFVLLRRAQFARLIPTLLLISAFAALPLLPWCIRNAITLHEFQPLTPKDANLPGELVPKGFMAWERTWLYRVRDCYLVPWKLNDEEIRLDDIPSTAFDSPDERDRVSAVLDSYNEDLTLTPEQDAAFAQLARERTARHPLRTYLSIPLKRAVRIWFTPRIELLPVSGNVFPLDYMWQEDPIDQRVTILFFLLNVFYVALAAFGFLRLWKFPAIRPVLLFLLSFLLLRTGFLTTLETPEPRYVLVCFPALLALAAQSLLPRFSRSNQ